MLFKIILRHYNVFVSSVETDGKLVNELKLEKDDTMPAVITQKIYYGYYDSVP